MLGHGNTSVCDLIIRQLWKHFRLPKMTPFVRQCQKALYDIATRHTVGVYWVPEHAGVQGSETFVGPEPFLEVSRQIVKGKIQSWFENQHFVMWCGPCSTQRQAQKLISGPSPTTKTIFLSFNRTQSRIVIGLLTGHNTVRRHLHLKGLTNSPLCRRCGAEE